MIQVGRYILIEVWYTYLQTIHTNDSGSIFCPFGATTVRTMNLSPISFGLYSNGHSITVKNTKNRILITRIAKRQFLTGLPRGYFFWGEGAAIHTQATKKPCRRPLHETESRTRLKHKLIQKTVPFWKTFVTKNMSTGHKQETICIIFTHPSPNPSVSQNIVWQYNMTNLK